MDNKQQGKTDDDRHQAYTPEDTASNSSVQQHHPTEYSNSLLPPTASRKKPEPVPFNTQRQGT